MVDRRTLSASESAFEWKPLEFEKPLYEIEKKITELAELSKGGGLKINAEIRRLQKKADKVRRDIFKDLTVMQKVQLARHINRPTTLDYIERMFGDFFQLSGDRCFAEDPSMICGIAKLEHRTVGVIGHQKGRNTTENIYRNFGMPRPEGYRKAVRAMELFERFQFPVVTFIDTPGAYPGVDAEARGQAEAIATSIMTLVRLKTPIVAVVIGEGGSGGALALGTGDRVFMLEHSIYSVISVEGCAAIVWKDAARAGLAAEALKLTAEANKRLGIVDGVISEPEGGAHRNPMDMAMRIKALLEREFATLGDYNIEELLAKRYDRYRKIGKFSEVSDLVSN